MRKILYILMLWSCGWGCLRSHIDAAHALPAVQIVPSSQSNEHYARILLEKGEVAVEVFQVGLELKSDKKLFSFTPRFIGKTFLYSRNENIYTVIVREGDCLEHEEGAILIYRNDRLIRHVALSAVDTSSQEWAHLINPFQEALGFAYFSEIDESEDNGDHVFFAIKDYRGMQLYYDVDTGKLRFVIGINR